ncbi:MAG: hypothetical protein V1492_04915 [Candidatus Micrarchaeota archaeon]
MAFDVMQLIGIGCGAALCIGFIAIVLFVLFGAGKNPFGSKPRSDVATVVNAEEQYVEFQESLDALKDKYKLIDGTRPTSLRELSLALVGQKQLRLLSGAVNGRNFSISAALAGDALVTKLEASGNFLLPIDVVTNSPVHLQGMAMDLFFVGGQPINPGKLQIRPEFQNRTDETRKALTKAVVSKLEALIFLKPGVMNLSSQLVETCEKKFTARKDKAVLFDYGLVRDKTYLLKLTNMFLDFSDKWEKAKATQVG